MPPPPDLRSPVISVDSDRMPTLIAGFKGLLGIEVVEPSLTFLCWRKSNMGPLRRMSAPD
jgi:hypothetical protein